MDYQRTPFEKQVFQAISTMMPTVGVWNGAEVMIGADEALPHLLVFHAGTWQDEMSEFVRLAPCIVLVLSQAGPGVRFELDEIRRFGKESHAILIHVPPPKTDHLAPFGVSPHIHKVDSLSDFPHQIWFDVPTAAMRQLRSVLEQIQVQDR